jgi:SAM-dependent methyltransferase
MDFPEDSFDIIWAEGSIFFVGFERGLREWGLLLKPGGCMAVHDDDRDISRKLELIESYGYTLLGRFHITRDEWWEVYFAPLEERIGELRGKYSGRPEAMAVLDEKQKDVDMVKTGAEGYGSVFYIMQKK